MPTPPPSPRPPAASASPGPLPEPAWWQTWWRSLGDGGLGLATLLVLVALLTAWPMALAAAPGLCVGPVCGDDFTRSAQYHWQLRLRLSDQQGHRERLVVDCRSGALSPSQGLVERGYAGAVARRACRLAGEG